MLRPIADTDVSLIDSHVTEDGYHVSRYRVPLEQVPADFYADPDGRWTFEGLAAAAGFEGQARVAVGALRHAFGPHPDGAAVVTLEDATRPYVAIIECPIAYELVADAGRATSAA